jgi:hypothetical protein
MHGRLVSDSCILNGTIKNWNQINAEALGTFPYKPKIFRGLGKQL